MSTAAEGPVRPDPILDALHKAMAKREEGRSSKDAGGAPQELKVYMHPASLKPGLEHIRGDIGEHLRKEGEGGGLEGDRIQRENDLKAAEEYKKELGLPDEVEIHQEYYADRAGVELSMIAFINQNTENFPDSEIEILNKNTLLLKRSGRPVSLNQFFVCGVTAGMRRTGFFI